MYGCNIMYSKRTKINRRRLNVRMPKNATEHVNIASPANPINRHCMPKRVRRKPNTRNAELLPEYLEVPFKVPNGELCIVLRTKKMKFGPDPGVALRDVAPQAFAEFCAKGYKPVLAPFPNHSDGH